MCVYNAEKYLSNTINSILCQTLSVFELIIIDDGSTDSSAETINNFCKADNRIKYFKTDNYGPALARNKGLELAQGDYVLFCDSDDLLAPEMLNELYSAALRDNADIVCCGYNMVIEDKNSSFIKPFLFKDIAFKNRGEFAKQLPDMMNKQLMYAVWNKLYNLRFLKATGVVFPDIRAGEDRMFNMQLLMCTNSLSFVNKALYNYKIHSTGITSGRFYYDKFYWMNRINTAQIMLFKELDIYKGSNIKLLNYFYFRMVLSAVTQLFTSNCKLNYSEKKEYIKNICKYDDFKKAIAGLGRLSIVNRAFAAVFKSNNAELIYLAIKAATLAERLFNKAYIKLKYKQK